MNLGQRGAYKGGGEAGRLYLLPVVAVGVKVGFRKVAGQPGVGAPPASDLDVGAAMQGGLGGHIHLCGIPTH